MWCRSSVAQKANNSGAVYLFVCLLLQYHSSPVKLLRVEYNVKTSASTSSETSESATSQLAREKPSTQSHLPVSKSQVPLRLQYWYSAKHTMGGFAVRRSILGGVLRVGDAVQTKTQSRFFAEPCSWRERRAGATRNSKQHQLR